tara:strand:- start:1314 stop:1703 length:390 start_codon:yes stop_codon:yes gene_type:complete
MSDYKYIKFTDLPAVFGQTERLVPAFNLWKPIYDSTSPFADFSIRMIVNDSSIKDIAFAVKGPDGTTNFSTGGAAGYEEQDYYNFTKQILNKFFETAANSTDQVTVVRAGVNGDIGPKLGTITSVSIAS